MSIVNEDNEITYIAKASQLKSGSFTAPEVFMDDYLMHEKVALSKICKSLQIAKHFYLEIFTMNFAV